MAKKPDPAPVFPGFVPETLKFLKALGFHQNKQWFDENRDLYVSALKEPMAIYVEALSAACAARKLPLWGDPARAMFRLNRDVRFSKDKKPYKTNSGCVLSRTGLKGSPGILYTHVSPDGCFLAAGFYHPEPEQLLAMRRKIAARPAAFVAVRKKLAAAGLDLSFLTKPRIEDAAGHIFFENTRQLPRENAAAQEAIGRLDLNYYIPCHARQKTIAFLGLGKTMQGDFLNSEDVELLEALAGYIGIAIQNGRLYASLEQKVSEYERLKDFNENIVESINVGVLAVDLQDRIESWNSQMEVMYAQPRWQVVGRSLREVFPAAFVEEFYRVRQNPGIHNLYKFRLATPTGESRIVNVAMAPLVTRKFNVVGRLVIVDDITERIELEVQLTQAGLEQGRDEVLEKGLEVVAR